MDENELKRQLLEKWLAQRDDLTKLIEALQRDLGQSFESTGNSNVANTQLAGTARASAQVSAALLYVKPGEFYGMSHTEAAQAYLRKVGHAVHIDKILEMLQAGGVKMDTKTPKANLYTALVRGTRRFVLVSPSTFGLAEFYPTRKVVDKKD